MTISMKKTVKKATEADIGKYVFATDSTSLPSVQQVEENCMDRRRKLVAVVPDEYAPYDPFITISDNGCTTAWHHAYIIREEPVPYTEGQAASGLKPGDWVKVTREAASGEGGWENNWAGSMDQYIGTSAKIVATYRTGVLLSCSSFRFPYFVLEKVTTRPATEEDTGKKCLYHTSECTIEAIFRTASDGKLTAALKSTSGAMCIAELEGLQVCLDQPQVARPSWLPVGWRQLGADEVIESKDKVQSNYHPDLPRSANAANIFAWAGAADSSLVNAQVGKKVSDSRYPKDIWIRKVE